MIRLQYIFNIHRGRYLHTLLGTQNNMQKKLDRQLVPYYKEKQIP